MTEFTLAQLHGAESLLREGLCLADNDVVLILYQEELKEAVQCINIIANTLQIEVRALQFKREEFFKEPPPAFSVDTLIQSPVIPRGIALLIEWSEETTRARLKLLEQLQDSGLEWRIASMPGVLAENFDSCIADFDEIEAHSLNVFSVLARSDYVEIETPNPYGEYDVLTIPITKYTPEMSTGRIGSGAWGNFPSGESFVVPDEFAAFGWITVYGSFPHYSLNEDQWVRFEVRKGRLKGKSIEASSSALRKRFASLFFNHKGWAKSRCTNALSELGIGTNPNITKLTGKPVFDEKKFGTLHIAFGRNTQFNGPIHSRVHHDITCTHVTMRAQKTAVLRRGSFILSKENAIPILSDFSSAPIRARYYVSAGAVSYRYKRDEGVLVVRYTTTRNKEIEIEIARDYDAELANKLLNVVRPNTKAGPSSTIKNGEFQGRKLETRARSIIRGLEAYKLIKTERIDNGRH